MENLLNSLPMDYVDLPLENWNLLDEFIPPKEVCHYTSRDTALKYILHNKEILLGNLSETNDPRETKTRIGKFINKPRIRPDVQGHIESIGGHITQIVTKESVSYSMGKLFMKISAEKF
jgi:hypothetical protein